MRVLLALLLVDVLAGACSWPEEDTVYPSPTAAIAWATATQTYASTTACPSTELGPVKVEWDAIHRGLSFGGEKVLLPHGFSARILTNGRLEILAPNGTVVARDGDTLELGGPDYMHVCSVQNLEY